MPLRSTGEFVRGPGQLTQVMRGFPRPWFVAGGWALDLFLDRQVQPRGQIEIAVSRRDQAYLPTQFHGWSIETVEQGQARASVPGQWLAPPRYQLRVSRAVEASVTELTRLEVALYEGEENRWQHRGTPAIELEREYVGYEAAAGLPVLIPEIVLLEAARGASAAQEKDFAAVLPALEDEGIAWLRWALAAAYPGHPWITRLDEAGGTE